MFRPALYPYSPQRGYTPPPAEVDGLRAHLDRQGLGRVVLVQPSCYGEDNRALVQALAELGPARARGVAVLDLSTTPDSALHALHGAGVRGLRFNLHVQARHDLGGVLHQLREAAARLAPWGWHLQLHADAALLHALQPGLEALAAPLVLDHFGGGPAAQGAVARLLATGRTWVKLSAPYRVPAEGLAEAVRQWAGLRPDRLLWGSDWPHTGGGGVRQADPEAIEPFRAVDLPQGLRALRGWLPDEGVWEQVFVLNPQALYGFDPIPAGADSAARLT